MTKRSSGPLTAHLGNPSMGSPLSMAAGTTLLARSRSSARPDRPSYNCRFRIERAKGRECHTQANRDQRSALRVLQSRQGAHLVEQSAFAKGKRDPHSTRIELKISHEELSVMVGTTGSRINMFMQRFHNLGLRRRMQIAFSSSKR